MVRRLQRLSVRDRMPLAATRCEQGAILIEAAFVFPILIIMFIGLIEFGEAFAVDRKLTSAASTVSDLVAQLSQVSAADLDDIARVADEIIKPYVTAPMSMVVSSVETDGNGAVTVGWSYVHGTGANAHRPGDSFLLPSGLAERNSSVIVTETYYQFTPGVALFLSRTITLSGESFFRPRLSSVVVFKN